MNKIFQIVFNAARGKMMVVNEATSSVQTGKKAAVTVAVIGALAAGSAMAEDIVYNGETEIKKGSDYTVLISGKEIKNVTKEDANAYGGALIVHIIKQRQGIDCSIIVWSVSGDISVVVSDGIGMTVETVVTI